MGGGGELFQIPSKHQLVLILHAIITWISHEVHAHTRTKVQFPWKTTSCVRRCVNYFWNFIPFSLMFFKISLNNFLNWDVNGMYWFNLWCWFMMMAGCKSVKKLRNFPHWHCFQMHSFCTLNWALEPNALHLWSFLHCMHSTWWDSLQKMPSSMFLEENWRFLPLSLGKLTFHVQMRTPLCMVYGQCCEAGDMESHLNCEL